MNKIAILGHFGGNKVFNDGQTVKTISIYKALKRYGIKSIDRIDTYYIRRNPLKFCLQFLKSLCSDEQYIVLLSDKGRKVLFPVLYLMGKFGKEIYHYAIGGRLAREVRVHKNWKKYISVFKSNWMESVTIANELQELGINNATYLPNFKKLNILTEHELQVEFVAPFQFCTFSRVMKEKGIEDAITAIEDINREAGLQLVNLDIYGAADDVYLSNLNRILENSNSCKYCGVIPSDESVVTIKNYYALLFPTHWRHEGIPGTVIDGLSAGVPIIARRWQYCDEILQHKVTGYIYNFEEPEKLKETILYAITHINETVLMKKECIQTAYKYSEDYVMQSITKQMGVDCINDKL